MAFIYAGALGNLIDSLFYGLIFQESDPMLQNVAKVVHPGDGYAGLMYGRVVDMWYFPIIKTTLPSWLPVWGGDYFEFFSPVFNTADVWVSTGVITLLVFQRRFAKKEKLETSNDIIKFHRERNMRKFFTQRRKIFPQKAQRFLFSVFAS